MQKRNNLKKTHHAGKQNTTMKLMSFNVQGNLVADKEGNSKVVLDFSDFQKKLEDMEDAHDLELIAKRKNDPLIPHDDFRKLLKSNGLL